jgi:hypothetical protein
MEPLTAIGAWFVALLGIAALVRTATRLGCSDEGGEFGDAAGN